MGALASGGSDLVVTKGHHLAAHEVLLCLPNTPDHHKTT